MTLTTQDAPETTETLRWRDGFLLGHAPLDDMHREFVEVVAALQAAPDADLPAALARVTEHLVAHFAQEDDWMQTTGYPATECHVNEHAAVLATAREMPALLAAGRTDLALDALEHTMLAGNGQALEDMIRSASEARAAWQIAGKK